MASSHRTSSDDESDDPPALREIPSCIRPGVFIGSVAAERDLNVLQALGITHVLQVCTRIFCHTASASCFLPISNHRGDIDAIRSAFPQ